MKALPLTLLALLAIACGGSTDPTPNDGPDYIYSHTVEGPSNACGYVYTTDPRVTLRCEPQSELVRICGFNGGSDVFDVYAEQGAGDGTPFGVASYVELQVTECGLDER
jgi:hypothetical protein